MQTLYEFPLSGGSGDRRLASPPIDTLRVVAVSEPAGYLIGFNERHRLDVDAGFNQGNEIEAGSGPIVERRPIVLWRPLSGEAKVVVDADTFPGQSSRIIDMTTAETSSRAVVLGESTGVDIGARQLVRQYWLLSIGPDGDVYGPVDFLNQPRGVWVDPFFRDEPPHAVREPKLCVGHLDGPGDVVVVARRVRGLLDERKEEAVVAIWLQGSDFSILREIVVDQQELGRDSAAPTIRAWPTLGRTVGGVGGDLHIGFQRGDTVRIHRVTRGQSARFNFSPFTIVSAAPGSTLQDFKLVGGIVDTRQMATNRSSGVGGESVGCVLLQQSGARGSLTLVQTYNSQGNIPARQVPLGTTEGSPSLLQEGDTGGRFLTADWSEGQARIRRLGTRGGVFYRTPLALYNPGPTALGAPGHELALCYHPILASAVVVTAQHLPDRSGNPWAICAVNSHRGHAAASPDLGSEGCAVIGLAHLPGRLSNSPVIGHAPYAGQRFFEIRLEGGPPRTNVWLVVGEFLIPSGLNVDPDHVRCPPRLDRQSADNASFSALTDGKGNVALRVPMDESALPAIFNVNTRDFATQGEILRFPPVIFAQWQWLSGNVDQILVKEVMVRSDRGLFDNERSRFVIRPSSLVVEGSKLMALVVMG